MILVWVRGSAWSFIAKIFLLKGTDPAEIWGAIALIIENVQFLLSYPLLLLQIAIDSIIFMVILKFVLALLCSMQDLSSKPGNQT